MNSNNSNEFFNSAETGVGYLNDIKFLQPKNDREGYYSCDINRLSGPCNDPKQVRYSVTVKASALENMMAIAQVWEQAGAKQKTFISFRISDAYPDSFIKKHGERAGELELYMKGRLLKITSCNINGERFELPVGNHSDSVDAQDDDNEHASEVPVPHAAPQGQARGFQKPSYQAPQRAAPTSNSPTSYGKPAAQPAGRQVFPTVPGKYAQNAARQAPAPVPPKPSHQPPAARQGSAKPTGNLAHRFVGFAQKLGYR